MRTTHHIRAAAVILASGAVLAGCGGSDLTADSSCKDYVAASRSAQTAAVQHITQQNGRAYDFSVQNNVDAKCSVSPDNTLSWAITGQSSTARTATTTGTIPSKLITGKTSCPDFAAAPESAQRTFVAASITHASYTGEALDYLVQFCNGTDTTNLTVDDAINNVAGNGWFGAGPRATTTRPLTLDSSCSDFLAAPLPEQDAFVQTVAKPDRIGAAREYLQSGCTEATIREDIANWHMFGVTRGGPFLASAGGK